MPNVSKLNIDNVEYNLVDTVARNATNTLLNDRGVNDGLIQKLRDGGLKVLMLGDSIGRGYGNNGNGILYYMQQEYPNNTYVNKAVDGATLATKTGGNYIQTQYESLSETFDLIFICIGINDLGWQGNNNVNLNIVEFPYDQFATLPTNDWSTAFSALHTLLYKLETDNPNASIFWISEGTYSANTALYTEFLKQIKYSVQMHNCRVIDIDPIFPAYNDTAARSKYFYDITHPNAEGYKLMYEWVKRSIQYDWNQIDPEFPFADYLYIGASVTPVSYTLGNIKDFILNNYPVAKRIADQIISKSITYANKSFIVTNLHSGPALHVTIDYNYGLQLCISIDDASLFCPKVKYIFSNNRNTVWVEVERRDYGSCPSLTLSSNTLSGQYFTTSQSLISDLPSGVFYSSEWITIDASFLGEINTSTGQYTSWHQRYVVQGVLSGSIYIYKRNNVGNPESHIYTEGSGSQKVVDGDFTRVKLADGAYLVYGHKTFSNINVNSSFGTNSYFYNFTVSLGSIIPNSISTINATPRINGGLYTVSIATMNSTTITGFIWAPSSETNKTITVDFTIMCT